MGGKRRRTSKPMRKTRVVKVPKTFDCPFCHKEDSVNIWVKYDQERGVKVGEIVCKNPECGEKDTMLLGELGDPIDAYCEWRDKLRERRDKEREQRKRMRESEEAQHTDSDDASFHDEGSSDNFDEENYTDADEEMEDLGFV